METTDDITFEVWNTKADGAEEFYALLGWIFASKQIRAELDGYPIDNDDDRYWVVALSPNKDRVVGFRSFGCSPEKNKAMFYDAWVHPEYRKKGIYSRMNKIAISQMISSCPCAVLTATANDRSLPGLLKLGLTVHRKVGRFHKLSGPLPAAK